VRHLSGGLRYCKAIGVELKHRGIVQVSINMTDYTKTALYRVFELIRIEAKTLGRAGGRQRDCRFGANGGSDRHGDVLSAA